MGVIHEETVIRGPVPSVHSGLGSGAADHRHCAWSASHGAAAGAVCRDARTLKGGSVASCESGLDSVCSNKFTPRVRAGVGSSAGTPSVHCEEVGRGFSKKTGAEDMKTLVVAQQKGGVGKTSSLVHLAFDFLERGLRVAVIDLDTQGNASFTLQEFASGYQVSQMFDQNGDSLREWFADLPNGPLMRLIESDAVLANMEKRTLTDAAPVFKDNIQALSDLGFDVVLIDTAPALGVSLAAALYAADSVLSPIELEAYSIQGIKKMLTTIANVRKINTKLQFLGMVPSKVDARNPRHVRHQDELQTAYPQLMIPVAIGLRSSIADALASGVPVWKIKKTAARKATKEVRALAAYVFEKMEIA